MKLNNIGQNLCELESDEKLMSTKGENYIKYVSVREWILSDTNWYYDFVEDTIVSFLSIEQNNMIINITHY